MAGGIVINGRFVARPGIYSNINYITVPGAPTQGSTLAIVGQFPFLQQNVPYLSTSQRDFESIAPQSLLLKQISSIVYNPFLNAATTAAPAEVYLISPVGYTTMAGTGPNTQAFTFFGGASGRIDVKAKQWGVMGNKTRFRITPNAALGGWNVVVANNGTAENIRVPAEPAALTLSYTAPEVVGSIVRGFGAWGAGAVNAGSMRLSAGTPAAGDVKVNFVRALPSTLASVAVNTAWLPSPVEGEDQGPVYGNVAAKGVAAVLTGGNLTVIVRGVDSATGESVEDTSLVFNSSNISDSRSTTTSFTAVTSVSLKLDTGATLVGGHVELSGQVFPLLNAAGGQKYVSDVLRYIQQYNAHGFSATTNSSRVSSVLLSDIDKVSDLLVKAPNAAAPRATLTLDGWKIVTTVNNSSNLVVLERANAEAPIIASSGFFSFLAGGREDELVAATAWGDALDELVWYDIDTISAFYDPTGTPAADDVVLAQFRDHLTKMWSDGANERTLWTGAGAGETLNELVERAASFNSERVQVVVDSAEIQQPDGSSSLMRPYWYALMHASADASLLTVDTLTRARLRVLAVERDASLYSQEVVNELIRGGLIISTTPPGAATRIEREVTTWTEDDNPARTEAICTRSVRASTKAMRSALNDLLEPGRGVLVLADVRSTVLSELSRQTNSVDPLITSYDARSITISEFADRYEIGYVITVRINKNFITLNVGVTVPVGTI